MGHREHQTAAGNGKRCSLFCNQSTPNPNMPLRGFIYLARIYQNYIKQTDANIYGKTLIPLPVPKYVVFYNSSGKYQIQSGKRAVLSKAELL